MGEDREPAKKTLEMFKTFNKKMENELTTIKINMEGINKDIEFIKKGQETNDAQHREILDQLRDTADTINGFVQSSTDRFVDKKYHDSIMKKLDESYAPIMAWTVIVWAARIIGGALILGLLGLLYKLFVMFG